MWQATTGKLEWKQGKLHADWRRAHGDCRKPADMLSQAAAHLQAEAQTQPQLSSVCSVSAGRFPAGSMP